MEIKLVPNTTVITEIVTEYYTVLRIDDQYNIEVTFIELLLNLNTDDKIYNITIDIKDFPAYQTLDEVLELKSEIEKFVKNNVLSLIADSKELD